MKKLIPLLLLLVAMPSLAQRQFDIEVIIFQRAIDAEKTQESWPNSLPEINLSRAGSLSDAQYRQSKGVRMLSQTDYQLTEQAQRLRNHAGFQVLLHTAWRQGDQGRASAPVFHIQAGKDYSTQFNPDGSERVAQTEQYRPIDGVVEQTVTPPLYELDGTLQIYVQHFLFAEANFDLKKPSVREVILQDPSLDLDELDQDTRTNAQDGHLIAISPTMEKQSFLKSYRLDQKRRMRSGETHYLDHPLMGMIIQVRRVQ
ncbi:peptidoglycan binding protein CsiV [Vibrio metschnikovii]|uniref:peptidoglycan binding protein CsiV n=1 Tax=Vibrio metschnikovii TaxID=28172 RepID=UPI001C2FF027|nr:peptidoglycan binding protein CsiV [Vibrio metschnikovii]